jgi:hypothetical protein
LEHRDFALLPSVTSQDFFEVLYLQEKRNRLQIERSLGLGPASEPEEVPPIEESDPSSSYKEDSQSWAGAGDEISPRLDSAKESAGSSTTPSAADNPSLSSDPLGVSKIGITMVDIEASDEEQEENSGSSVTPWWIGHSLLNEISSRNPEEVKQVQCLIFRLISTEVTPVYSFFIL